MQNCFLQMLAFILNSYIIIKKISIGNIKDRLFRSGLLYCVIHYELVPKLLRPEPLSVTYMNCNCSGGKFCIHNVCLMCR